MSVVAWHEVECGGYAADLPLWRELAASARGPILDQRRRGRPRAAVLDVGAGTGRVALDLAARGHEVVALDRQPELLAELRRRAGELPVWTVCADARSFDLARDAPPGTPARFPLVLVPMQTLQILGGAEARAAFLRAAHRHLEPDGTLAAALADPLEGLDDAERTEPPLPDIREIDGTVFSSQVVAVRPVDGAVAIDRLRQTVDPAGALDAEADTVTLDDLDAAALAAEAEPLGYRALQPRRIPATEEHVGSEVVVLCRMP